MEILHLELEATMTQLAKDVNLPAAHCLELKHVYARQGVEMLRKAVEKGFNNAKELQAPVYDPLRRQQNFQQLLNDLEQKKALVG